MRTPKDVRPELWGIDPATGELPHNTVALIARSQGVAVVLERGGRKKWHSLDYGDVVTGHFASLVPWETTARLVALRLRYEYDE